MNKEFVKQEGPVFIIKIRQDKVYGYKCYYPVCDKAQRFADIAGTKTLTVQALNQIKRLGVAIQLVHEELDIKV